MKYESGVSPHRKSMILDRFDRDNDDIPCNLFDVSNFFDARTGNIFML